MQSLPNGSSAENGSIQHAASYVAKEKVWIIDNILDIITPTHTHEEIIFSRRQCVIGRKRQQQQVIYATKEFISSLDSIDNNKGKRWA